MNFVLKERRITVISNNVQEIHTYVGIFQEISLIYIIPKCLRVTDVVYLTSHITHIFVSIKLMCRIFYRNRFI